MRNVVTVWDIEAEVDGEWVWHYSVVMDFSSVCELCARTPRLGSRYRVRRLQ